MTSSSTTASISRGEFVRNLEESALFTPDELRNLLTGFPSDKDGLTLAQALIGKGVLTPHQAAAIVERRFQWLRVGNYDILDRLGSGGMGTVYKASHRRMKRLVAVKLLPAELAAREAFVQRFQREVQTIARLSHPNIVMAFDADESELGPYLVMEYVNGRDLASDVQQGGPLAVADAVHCVIQAGRGLAYAHAQGIIHRDVKPANLLRDAGGLIKVADLGLARLTVREHHKASSSLTQAGGLLGTADFMAPEQALDSTSIDYHADIYSLGCTWCFLLTGRPPYAAGSLMGLLLKHREAPIPSLREARPEIPEEVDAVFRRMVAKKPEDRYATMDETVAALEAVEDRVRGLTVRPGQRGEAAIPPSEATVAHDSRDGMPTATDPAPRVSLSDVKRVADLTVVLVEPSRTQAAIIRKYLHQLGIDKIHPIGDGKLTLALAREKQADVILSTMHLADMTGLQLHAMLHANPACEAIGFVLMTSEADSLDTAALGDAPYTVLLPKPFDLRQLARALAQATGRAVKEILPEG